MATKRGAQGVLALFAPMTRLTAGCSGSGGGEPSSELSQNPVTLTWWHNASQDGPGKTYWSKVASDFSKLHPSVTIQIEAIETNQLQRTRIPAALLTDDPPDIFQAWGGGEVRTEVEDDSHMTRTEQH